MFVKKPLSTFFGIVLGGIPFAMNILPSYVSLVLSVPNGLNVFSIAVGSSVSMIMGFDYSPT